MRYVLARVPALRLVRTTRGWLPIAGWAVLAVVSAWLARSSTSGADHVMRGPFSYLVMPLVPYGIVGAAVGHDGLRRGIRGVVALGAESRRAALASVAVAVLAAAAACGLLAAFVCLLAHGIHDPPLLADLPASIGVGALGGGAYAAYFCAGSAVSIGRGTLRGTFLALDWILGAGAGVGSLLTPRGHVQSLLGGELAAELGQRSSSLLLLVMVIVYGALAVQLARRA